jgi:CspA family cold shock protein
MASIKGRVKWFDATRGFGFLVSDEVEGDVLLHFSVLREHGRRSVPEGASIECVPIRVNRGLQARRVLSIDLSTATAATTRLRSPFTPQKRSEREALHNAASAFEPVEVKWFNRTKGYGFVKRSGDDVDIFVHMETVRQAGLIDLQPGERVEARFAQGPKGLTAVELRTP